MRGTFARAAIGLRESNTMARGGSAGGAWADATPAARRRTSRHAARHARVETCRIIMGPRQRAHAFGARARGSSGEALRTVPAPGDRAAAVRPAPAHGS